MAPTREDSDLASEEGDLDGSPECREHSESPLSTNADPTDKRASPETRLEHIFGSKADIKNMLSELNAYFSADIMLVREDLGVMTS
ncbi:Hypothetical predicted protein [Pelobates cultripes]|uniref:Uncharacterized protein n=1 Tax=Pelobates cultripes TaxID=61616 RepID=A0AAD1S5R4_PELCU|nr:Hypothetical predicted protein [Pelobates cultripes]